MDHATATTPQPNQRIAAHSWWRRVRTSFFGLLFTALRVRLVVIFITHTYNFKTVDDNFSFGYEMGRIGRSLASGQGFANPFNETTGPTAWEPPLYPFLIAGVFKGFGIYTRSSALALLILNSIFSALTCIPIFLIARRCFNENVAVWGWGFWAMMTSGFATGVVWETRLASSLLS